MAAGAKLEIENVGVEGGAGAAPTTQASTTDPTVERFADDDLKGANEKEHAGFRQKMLRTQTLVTMMVMILFVSSIGLIIGLATSKSETVASFSAATGHDFMLKANIMVHPDYTGELDPSGTVSISFDDDDHFLITTQVQGLEEKCEFCSVKVYSGGSCFDAIGPSELPFWNNQTVRNNPWEHVHYNSVGGTTHSAVATNTGHGPEGMEGHVVILDDSQGQHIACGILERDTTPRKVQTLYATLANLPRYTMTQVGGIASLQFFEDDTFIFNFQFQGLPPLCSHCQLSLQDGTTCEPDEIGSHHFDHEELERDPWVAGRGAYYNSDGRGYGHRSFFLYNGHGYSENKGHVLLLKSADGTRIACGVLGTKRITPKMGNTVS